MTALVDQLQKTKQIIINNEGINPYTKIEMKALIDQLTIDLNNELQSTSEDIQKIKKGLCVNVDSKKTKRRVRRLEEESKLILVKVNSLSGLKESYLEQTYSKDRKDKERRRSYQPTNNRKKPEPPKYTYNSNA